MAAPAFNIVLAGEFGVGKTSIFVRYERNTFLKYTGSTFGVDRMTKDVIIDGELRKVHVWDTVGMERNRSLTSNYYKEAHAVLLVFAVDDSSSLNALRKWIEDVEKYAPKETKTFLVGNKIDLDNEEFQVETSTIKSFADNGNMAGSYSVSALTGVGVMEMFDDILMKLKQGSMKPSMPQDNAFCLDDTDAGKKKGAGCPC